MAIAGYMDLDWYSGVARQKGQMRLAAYCPKCTPRINIRSSVLYPIDPAKFSGFACDETCCEYCGKVLIGENRDGMVHINESITRILMGEKHHARFIFAQYPELIEMCPALKSRNRIILREKIEYLDTQVAQGEITLTAWPQRLPGLTYARDRDGNYWYWHMRGDPDVYALPELACSREKGLHRQEITQAGAC